MEEAHEEGERTILIFAVDKSGSTSNSPRYWDTVGQALQEVARDGSPQSREHSVESVTHQRDTYPTESERSRRETIFVLWDWKARVVGRDELENCMKMRKGTGGTRLASVAEFISKLVKEDSSGDQRSANAKIQLLLITDGQINTSDVRESDTYLLGIDFDLVNVHLEVAHPTYDVDVSVAAPFLRRSQYFVKVNGEVKLQGDTRRKLSLPDVSTLEEFENIKDKIWQMVYPRVVGTGQLTAEENQALHGWILETKKAILATIARNSLGQEEPIHRLHQLLQEGREEEVVAIIRNGRAFEEPSPGQLVEAAFAPLISISSRIQFSFSGYHCYPPTRLSRMPDSGPVDEKDLWGDFEDSEELGALACEITGEDDIPVLMFKDVQGGYRDGLFSGFDTSVFNRLANQPLNTLRKKEALELLVSSIDHVIGLKAYVRWTSQPGWKTSPYTRSPLAGALPISTQKSLVTYGNKFLCRFLWGGKKVGIPVMWHWVVYFAIRDHPKLEFLRSNYPQFLKSLEKVLAHRSSREKTRLGMSGLGDYPMELVPVAVAAWYCVRGSSVIYGEKLLYRAQERLLQFRSIADELAEITTLCNIPLDHSSVKERVKQLRLTETLFNLGRSDKIYAEKLIGALRFEAFPLQEVTSTFSTSKDEQEFVLYDTELTESDLGAQMRKLPTAWEGFSFEFCRKLYGIKVGPYLNPETCTWPVNKYTGVPLPLPEKLNDDLEAVELNSISSERKYSYKKDAAGNNVFFSSPICPGTMRCWYVDQATGKHWKECAEEAMGPLESQLSNYNYYTKAFSKCYKSLSVKERETGLDEDGREVGYPNLRQFMVTIEKGQRAKGFLCLPAGCHRAAERIMEQFQEARDEYCRVKKTKVTPAVFREILRRSQDIQSRQRLEAEWNSFGCRASQGLDICPTSMIPEVSAGYRKPWQCFKGKGAWSSVTFLMNLLLLLAQHVSLFSAAGTSRTDYFKVCFHDFKAVLYLFSRGRRVILSFSGAVGICSCWVGCLESNWLSPLSLVYPLV